MRCFRKELKVALMLTFFNVAFSVYVYAMTQDGKEPLDNVTTASTTTAVRPGLSTGSISQTGQQVAVANTVNQNLYAAPLPRRFISSLGIPQRRLGEALVLRPELDQAVEFFQSGNRRVVFTGPQGVGKSYLAYQVGLRWKERPHHVVRWFTASDEGALLEDYRHFARESIGNIFEGQDRGFVRGHVNTLLSDTPNVLLIFDNVEQENILNFYLSELPQTVNVLFTTTNPQLRLPSIPVYISMDSFNDTQAREYVRDTWNTAGRIFQAADIERLIYRNVEEQVYEVGRLPIRLGWAAYYLTLEETLLISVDEFLREVEAARINGTIEDDEDYRIEHNRVLDPIFTFVIRKLIDSAPRAWQMLRHAALLDPTFIPLTIFEKVFHPTTVRDLSQMSTALQARSLARQQELNGIKGISLHRLAQEEAINFGRNIPTEAPELLRLQLVEIVERLFPNVEDTPGMEWVSAKLYFPHAVNLLKGDPRQIQLIANLEDKIGEYLGKVGGSYQASLDYHDQALKIRRALYPNQNHSDIAKTLRLAGWRSRILGKPQEYLDLSIEALKMRQSLYPHLDHPDVAQSLHDVGVAHCALSHHTEARGYIKQAVQMRQSLYSGDHPDTARSLNTLGWVYDNDGDYPRALKFCMQALEMMRRFYKEQNHADIGHALNNVGRAYLNLSKIKDAFASWQEALEMRKSLYPGQSRSEIVTSIRNVGVALFFLENRNEAFEKYKEALKMQKSLFFNQPHRHTAILLGDIGTVYCFRGYHTLALKFFNESLEMLKTVFPNQNTDEIAVALSGVGSAYLALNQPQVALNYLVQARDMLQALFPNPSSQKSKEISDILLLIAGINFSMSMNRFTQASENVNKNTQERPKSEILAEEVEASENKHFDNFPYQVIQDGQNTPLRILRTADGRSFKEHNILEDGNCGFTALGIDRGNIVQQIVHLLLRNPSDPLLVDVVRVLTAEMKEHLAAELPDVITMLNTYVPPPEEISRYVKETYGTAAQGGGSAYLRYSLNSTGMMAAIAYINNIEIHVFIQQPDGFLQEVFTHRPAIPNSSFYLLHTAAKGKGALNHFNLLVEEGV